MKLTIQKGSLGLGLVLLWVGVLNTGTDSLFYNSLLFPIVGAFLRIGTVLPVLKMLVYLMSTLFALLLGWELIQSGIYSGMISFSIFMTMTYAALIGIGALILSYFRCLFNQTVNWKKRSVLGVMGTFLLLWILAGANSLIGNPFDANKATKAIEGYVEHQYPKEDLKVKEATYVFETASYQSLIYHEENEDLNFSVSYQNGEIVDDTYESHVLSYFNTLKRLSAQYSILVNELLNEKFHLKENQSFVYYDFDAVDYMSKILELGMEFDETLPISAQITLQFTLETQSIDELNDFIVSVFEVLEEKGYHFDVYHLKAQNQKECIWIESITPNDILSGQLAARIEAGLANVSSYGIKTNKSSNKF
ncbi:hypothetical protein GMA92_07285 [Turicibacter sanguinis]|uniref:Uncharacterized protein n=2 Tax=Turicibacter sanguinis TaxID=154288 RepID=A0A9X5ANC2_9FIRM|nr:hypothetical protein [Turicibacter sanguinis]EFF62840.1 hypothetical protein CUW_0032 [Turicibacter sanguinis PC909]MTK21223.1 hypothetical protein [Turicibacter sanguinis]MTK71754.1 hypothetical protein [Turicibacter sanguinis]